MRRVLMAGRFNGMSRPYHAWYVPPTNEVIKSGLRPEWYTLYEKPDGTVVKVNHVSEQRDAYPSIADEHYIGIVTKWVRSISGGIDNTPPPADRMI